MSPVPRDSFLVVRELLDALAELRRATKATEVAIARALRKADQGAEMTSVLVGLEPSKTRQAMNDALQALEHARHEMRLAVFASALEEGTSIGELGRIFGFSRQLAARYAKEAHGED